jgi:hypothetical protein
MKPKPGAHIQGLGTPADVAQRLNLLEGIALGEVDVAAGRLVSQVEAKRRMAKWLG